MFGRFEGFFSMKGLSLSFSFPHGRDDVVRCPNHVGLSYLNLKSLHKIQSFPTRLAPKTDDFPLEKLPSNPNHIQRSTSQLQFPRSPKFILRRSSFTKPIRTSNHIKRSCSDEEPLLTVEEEDDLKMRFTRRFDPSQRVTPSGIQHSRSDLERDNNGNRFKIPSLRAKRSDDSWITSATSGSVSSESANDQSPLLTAKPIITPGSPTSATYIPSFSREVQDSDVDGFCDRLMSRRTARKPRNLEWSTEASTSSTSAYVGSSAPLDETANEAPRGQGKDDEVEGASQPSQQVDENGSTLLSLLESIERGWTSYTEPVKETWNAFANPVQEWRLVPKSFASDMGALVSSSSSDKDQDSQQTVNSTESSGVKVESEIIQRQQVEIAYLRAELARQQDFIRRVRSSGELDLRRPTSWPALTAPPPIEEIDTIPVENIEVALDGFDEISIFSGLTGVNDSVRFVDDESIAPEEPPSLNRFHHEYIPPVAASSLRDRRPDAASVIDNDSVLPTSKVKNFPLQLTAANGSVRKALYTGPRKGGVCTGVGVLKFETGDTYSGEVVNGKVRQLRADSWLPNVASTKFVSLFLFNIWTDAWKRNLYVRKEQEERA